jgi:hypothetical protein
MSDVHVRKSNRGRKKALTDSTRKLHKQDNSAKYNKNNQTATYFLRSRLFTYDIMKSSTAISIKHRLLATFNIKKINSEVLYSFKRKHSYVYTCI